MEREQRQVGRRVDHDVRQRGDARERVEREPALLGDRVAEGRRAEQLHAQPHPQTGEAARQVGAVLARIVEVVGMRHRRQVVGRGLVRRPQRRPVAHQQRAGAVGQEHPLVRIERERVGARHAAERRLQASSRAGRTRRRRRRRGARGPPSAHRSAIASSGSTAPVLVVPALETTANGVRPAARSAAMAARSARDRQPIPGVAGQGAHAVGHDAGELGRLEHAVMRLVGGVEHAAPDVGAEMALARAQHGVEGRHRPAGGEQTARRLRESPSSRAASRARWPRAARAPAPPSTRR